MRDAFELLIIYFLAGMFIIFSLGLLFEIEIHTNRVILWIITLLLAYTILKRKD